MLYNLKALLQTLHDVKLRRDKLEGLVKKRLREVLSSAYHNVPYYREVMQSVGYNPEKDYSGPSDLQVLPITTKEDIKERGVTAFVKKGVNLSKFFSDSTSGSTGIPLRTYKTSYERAVQISKWLRVLFVNGYSLNHKIMAPVSPDRVKEGRSFSQRFGYLKRLAVDYVQNSPKEMLVIFLSYNPDVLYGNRSHLNLMALELKRRQIQSEKLNLKLLVGAAEVIRESNRRLYKKQVGIQLVENYGSVEMGTVAYETHAHDGLHLCEDLTYFEFLNDNGKPVPPGEPGKVIVSDLTGKLMPFIRYNQGDLAVINYKKDGNGIIYPRISKIMGRDNDYVIMPDRNRIPVHTFNKLIGKYDQIIQFRIVQRPNNQLKILISADPSYLSKIRDDLKNQLKQNLPSIIDFEIIRTNQISPDPTGKIRALISEVPHS